MKKKNVLFSGVAALTLFLAACGSSDSNTDSAADTASSDNETVKIGVVSEVEVEVWEDVASRLDAKGIELEIVQFTDYVQPNVALENGDIDLNAFQHVAYLEDFNANNESDLTPIGFTYVSPLGLYSEKVTDYADIAEDARIAIPNDVTNGGRALLLLQAIGLIELDEAKGTTPTVNDIIENPKNINFEELDAAQIARSLQDVDAAVINTNYATDSGLNPKEDALFLDTDNIASVADVYKNIIAARSEDIDNETYKQVVAEYQTSETAALLDDVTAGNDVPAWEQ